MNKKLTKRPTAGFRNLPDPISYRLTYRRYNSEPGTWQVDKTILAIEYVFLMQFQSGIVYPLPNPINAAKWSLKKINAITVPDSFFMCLKKQCLFP